MTCPQQNHWYAIVSAKIDEENRMAKHSMNKNNEIDAAQRGDYQKTRKFYNNCKIMPKGIK
ncbi:hypothetical protein CJ231_00200 [Hoylesella buccalis]|uniref:Uncharacterized protein n=1 Tax=Hoylesella buccalis TaxID=28127 RepID=A0A2N6QTA6_9BACT|nr:hypothetical protein CJ231_00200 [Hoylesella buccalis]